MGMSLIVAGLLNAVLLGLSTWPSGDIAKFYHALCHIIFDNYLDKLLKVNLSQIFSINHLSFYVSKYLGYYLNDPKSLTNIF